MLDNKKPAKPKGLRVFVFGAMTGLELIHYPLILKIFTNISDKVTVKVTAFFLYDCVFRQLIKHYWFTGRYH
jgi:hypothetical protein